MLPVKDWTCSVLLVVPLSYGSSWNVVCRLFPVEKGVFLSDFIPTVMYVSVLHDASLTRYLWVANTWTRGAWAGAKERCEAGCRAGPWRDRRSWGADVAAPADASAAAAAPADAPAAAAALADALADAPAAGTSWADVWRHRRRLWAPGARWRRHGAALPPRSQNLVELPQDRIGFDHLLFTQIDLFNQLLCSLWTNLNLNLQSFKGFTLCWTCQQLLLLLIIDSFF